jgi:hypothetical protein
MVLPLGLVRIEAGIHFRRGSNPVELSEMGRDDERRHAARRTGSRARRLRKSRLPCSRRVPQGLCISSPVGAIVL